MKIRDLGDELECPVCGTKTPPDATECPECGEILEDVLVIEEEAGRGRISRITFRIGLIIFLIGFLISIYSPLHDGLGMRGIPSFFPGYEAYHVFGGLNWLVLWTGSGVFIVGIIIMLLSFVINRFATGRKAAVEESEPEE